MPELDQKRWELFSRFFPQEGRALAPDMESDEEIFAEWNTVVPTKDWGETSVNLGDPAFRKAFAEALKSQNMDQFLRDWYTNEPNPIPNMYVARSEGPRANDTETRTQSNHSDAKLDEIQAGLDAFSKTLGQSTIPKAIASLYIDKVRATNRQIKLARALGTPAYTELQKSKEELTALFDLQKTKETGVATLKYEDDAEEILRNNEKSKLVYHNVIQPLVEVWHLSVEEEAELGFDELTPETTELTPEQGKRLFTIILKRLELINPEQGKRLFTTMLRRLDLINWWMQDTPGSAIDVSPTSKAIKWPLTRKLTGDDIAYVVAHEMVHVIRGENGSRQASKMMGFEVEGFQSTEEGLATAMELINGQPFGHRRQVLFAARYWAVAQALKVETDPKTGERKAKHSIQEIYNNLLTFHIEEKDALELVWRIFRGTSLQQQVVDLQIDTPELKEIPVAETFIKDTVYFLGQMKLTEILKQTIPLLQEDLASHAVTSSKDFSARILARVGRAIVTKEQQDGNLDANANFSTQEAYAQFVALGKTAMLQLVQHFAAGTLTAESLLDPKHPLQPYITWDGLVQYWKIFEPRKAEATQG